MEKEEGGSGLLLSRDHPTPTPPPHPNPANQARSQAIVEGEGQGASGTMGFGPGPYNKQAEALWLKAWAWRLKPAVWEAAEGRANPLIAFSSCVTPGKSLNLPGPQSPHLYNL